MKKLVLVAALAAALGACSQAAEEADDTAAVETPAAEATVAEVGAEPGTYDVTLADGSKMTAQLNADGTYSDTVDGEVTETGTWAITDGKTCFTPAEGSEGTPTCYTDGPEGADGTFTVTPDEGEPMTVKKIG